MWFFTQCYQCPCKMGQCRDKMETDWINVPINQGTSMISGKPWEVRERYGGDFSFQFCKEKALLMPWALTSSSQDCEIIDRPCLTHQVCGMCYDIPRNEKQVYMYVCNHNKAQASLFLDGECGSVVDFLTPWGSVFRTQHHIKLLMVVHI